MSHASGSVGACDGKVHTVDVDVPIGSREVSGVDLCSRRNIAGSGGVSKYQLSPNTGSSTPLRYRRSESFPAAGRSHTEPMCSPSVRRGGTSMRSRLCDADVTAGATPRNHTAGRRSPGRYVVGGWHSNAVSPLGPATHCRHCTSALAVSHSVRFVGAGRSCTNTDVPITSGVDGSR